MNNLPTFGAMALQVVAIGGVIFVVHLLIRWKAEREADRQCDDIPLRINRLFSEMMQEMKRLELEAAPIVELVPAYRCQCSFCASKVT